jgi:hypothetical protein
MNTPDMTTEQSREFKALRKAETAQIRATSRHERQLLTQIQRLERQITTLTKRHLARANKLIRTDTKAIAKQIRPLRKEWTARTEGRIPDPKLKDETREGRRVQLTGTRHRATVIFSSDLLIKSFRDGSAKHKQLLAILTVAEPTTDPTTLLKHFYTPPHSWETPHKDGQAFRKVAAEYLKEPHAAAFVAACRAVDKHHIPKSRTTIDTEPNA